MGESTPVPSHRARTPLDLDYIDRAMTFIPSERCTISCGTVCVDPKASRVLIIFNRRLGIWQLPKGRKDIGEDLHSAALRETYEETGVRACLLPLVIQTRCTKPQTEDWAAYDTTGTGNPGSMMTHRMVPSIASVSSASTAYSTSTASSESSTTALEGTTPADAVYDVKMTCDIFNNEPVGIVNYPDLQVSTPDTIKTVFFYAACADSNAPMGKGAQDAHEDLVAEWTAFEVASERLRFAAENEVMLKVRADIERTENFR